MDPQDWLSTGQVARTLGISSQRVWFLAKQGRIEHVAGPNGFLFRRQTIEELARQRAARSEAVA